MSTEQHLGIMNVAKLLMINCNKPKLLKPVAFLAIMDDIAKAIQLLLFGKFLFRLANGACHTKAKARALVDFYLHSEATL